MASSSSSSRRFFANPYEDHDGRSAPDVVDKKLWLGRLLDLASDIRGSEARWRTAELDGGIYVGPAGIGFAFYSAAEQLRDVLTAERRRDFLSYARDVISSHLDEVVGGRRRQDDAPDVRNSFLLGRCGLYSVMAAVAFAQNDRAEAGKYAEAVSSMSAHFEKPGELYRFGSDELFVGRAGFVCAALWLREVFGSDVVPRRDLAEVCGRMYDGGVRNAEARPPSRRRDQPIKLMYSYHGTEYVGAGHGLSSVLQMMLSVGGSQLREARGEEAWSDVRGCVDYFVDRIRTGTGGDESNYPPAMDEAPPHGTRAPKDQLFHWCHGAPGVVHLFAAAFLAFRDRRFLEAALQCGDAVWRRGLLKKGPGICHGVAGNGFVFLLLYRLTGDARHLHRAERFAEFLYTDRFRAEARTPDRPHSLYEGTAGAMCFLAALLKPESAAFPFFGSVFVDAT